MVELQAYSSAIMTGAYLLLLVFTFPVYPIYNASEDEA